MFRVLSQMSENFVFIYLGVNLFLQTQPFFLLLILFVIAVCMIARYASVVPLSLLINWASRGDAIPRNHQLMVCFYQPQLFWAGLRGAIAFALSFEIQDGPGPVMKSTVLVVCVVSIILLGGSTNYALERLEIKTGVAHSHQPDSDAESDGGDEAHWFTDFDDYYLKPIFSSRGNRGEWVDAQRPEGDQGTLLERGPLVRVFGRGEEQFQNASGGVWRGRGVELDRMRRES